MREHLAKFVIVGLLVLVVGLPFVLRPLGAGGSTGEEDFGEPVGKLIVITPHNEQIRFELSHAFNRWRVDQGLGPITFDWRASGGTTDLRRGILSQFEGKAAAGRIGDGIGADLFFGGGEYDHNKLAKGIAVVDAEGNEVMTPVAVAPNLPDGLLEEAFPTATIGGERLYHKDLLWVGTCLSSFGIVYNRDLLAMLELDEPTTWADLADGRYENWVALADPGHSGSISATFNTVLRRQGWTEGWATMRRVYANARYFSSAASKVPVDVSAGEAAAGMCIDFYGRTQAGAVAADGWTGDIEGKGISRVGYADPVVAGKSMTATTADPITLLLGAPNRELAEQFVAWNLSKSAQRLWQAKVGTEDGPIKYELRRQPIRRDLFTAEQKADWSDPEIDPFPTAVAIMPGMPDFFGAVAPVTQAMAIDIHNDLVAAWRAILRTPDSHPDKPEMLRLFDQMPEVLTLTWPDKGMAQDWQAILSDENHPRHGEAAKTLKDFMTAFNDRDDDQKLKDKLAWTLFIQKNYRQIASMGAD